MFRKPPIKTWAESNLLQAHMGAPKLRALTLTFGI